MGTGRFAEACPKFAESQRLDPGGGTLLNLAVCHEKQGKLATAWAEYQEALAQAKSDAREDRVLLAEERISVLESQLARVTVVVKQAASSGVSVTVNGTPLGPAAWGVPMPVDAGEVRVEASAKGSDSFEKVISIDDGEALVLEIPVLAVAKAGGGQEPANTKSRDNTAAYVVGGVGLAALGAGGYFGVRALQEHSRAEDEGCSSGECTTRAGRQADENAVFNGWLSTIGIGAGLAAVGVAIYLYEPARVSGEPRQDRQGVAVVPALGPHNAGLDVIVVY